MRITWTGLGPAIGKIADWWEEQERRKALLGLAKQKLLWQMSQPTDLDVEKWKAEQQQRWRQQFLQDVEDYLMSQAEGPTREVDRRLKFARLIPYVAQGYFEKVPLVKPFTHEGYGTTWSVFEGFGKPYQYGPVEVAEGQAIKLPGEPEFRVPAPKKPKPITLSPWQVAVQPETGKVIARGVPKAEIKAGKEKFWWISPVPGTQAVPVPGPQAPRSLEEETYRAIERQREDVHRQRVLTEARKRLEAILQGWEMESLTPYTAARGGIRRWKKLMRDVLPKVANEEVKEEILRQARSYFGPPPPETYEDLVALLQYYRDQGLKPEEVEEILSDLFAPAKD
jgi:hypothetical protein